MDIHCISLWKYWISSGLQRGPNPLSALPEIGLFKAINPNCEESQGPKNGKKKKRIGTNSYSSLTWWKPVCLSKFTYHSGLIRPQKKKLEVSWKHKQTFQKSSCLCWLSKSVLHDRKCSQITIKKMLFWRMYWVRWMMVVGSGCLRKEICL